MDPFQLAMLLMSAAQQPEMAGKSLEALGIPAPGMPGSPIAMPGGSVEGNASAVPGTAFDFGGMGAALTGQGFFPSAAPGMPETGAAPAGGPAAQAQPRQVPPQVKAPEPIKPIMSGGVTGGVQTPKSDTNFSGVGPAIALLQQIMSGAGNQNPLRVPVLSGLFGGR